MAENIHADLSSTLQARADVVRQIEENSAAAAQIARENASKEVALRSIEEDVQKGKIRAEESQGILKKAVVELKVEEAENFKAVDESEQVEADLAKMEEDLEEVLKKREKIRAKFLADHTEMFVDDFSELASIASGRESTRNNRLQRVQKEKEDLIAGHKADKARVEAFNAEEEEATNALAKMKEEGQRAADDLAYCKLELAKLAKELEAEELPESDEDSFNTSIDEALEDQNEEEMAEEEEEDIVISRGGDMISNLIPGSP